MDEPKEFDCTWCWMLIEPHEPYVMPKGYEVVPLHARCARELVKAIAAEFEREFIKPLEPTPPEPYRGTCHRCGSPIVIGTDPTRIAAHILGRTLCVMCSD